MSLKCKIFSLKKYLHFEISVYDRDKHCYFGKHSCYISKFFQKNSWFFMLVKIYMRKAFMQRCRSSNGRR